jgi:hypothetical protein
MGPIHSQYRRFMDAGRPRSIDFRKLMREGGFANFRYFEEDLSQRICLARPFGSKGNVRGGVVPGDSRDNEWPQDQIFCGHRSIPGDSIPNFKPMRHTSPLRTFPCVLISAARFGVLCAAPGIGRSEGLKWTLSWGKPYSDHCRTLGSFLTHSLFRSPQTHLFDPQHFQLAFVQQSNRSDVNSKLRLNR